MFENDDLNPAPEKHPLVSLLTILAVIAIGFIIIGPLIGFILSLPFYPGNITEYAEGIQNIEAHPEIKLPFYVLQGSATFFGLIIGPALYLKSERKSLGSLFYNQRAQVIPILITVLVVIAFMPLNSLFIDWNSNLHLPEFLKGLEEWARMREDEATRITKFLTHFDSTFEVAVAVVVIALLPAIGEEIVFRGLIQNELFRGTKNIHISIWISAILFSAIHIQFFGFVPRMLLGALFGYLYYWSGSLNLAILAHFVNNAASVIGMYLFQLGTIKEDMESSEAASWPAVLSSLLLTVLLLYSFHRFYKQPQSNSLD
jgi:membrane protease YdiL (CAAX protease family)